MKYLRLFPVIFLILAMLACNLPTSSPTPTAKPVVENTPVKENTAVPVPTLAPTAPPEATPLTSSGNKKPGAIDNLKDAEKAVVRIVAQGSVEDPGFGNFEQAGSGTGFVIDPSGLVVTNNHVVRGAGTLEVYFSGDPNPRMAKLLGVSECSDLAVIDLVGDNYPFLSWYEGPIELGMKVYSLGYPLGDPEFTRHEGNISKKSAKLQTNWTAVESLIEHDAIINPGNSGGPLVNDNGEVVGVNYAYIGGANQYYAITFNEIEPVLQDLISGKNVLSLGINGEAFLTDNNFAGIWIYSVISGSPADIAGLKGGDILTNMEGITLAREGTMAEYCNVLRTHDPAKDVLTVKGIRYKTGEALEGQINGRKMEVVGQADVSGGGQQASVEETPTSESQPYYTEEFDTELKDWTYFVQHGDESQMNLSTDSGKLIFDIQGEQTYIYLTYNAWKYQDVRLDAVAENRGENSNNISLICRYSDEGWYEFSVGSDGTWWIYKVDPNASDVYTLLYNGGSNAIHMGKKTNTFTSTCVGDALTLYINGQKARTVHDTTFREGLVGVSVSSLDRVPVNVEVENISISEP